MLKQILNTTTHAFLRQIAQEAVASLPAKEVRTLIHRKVPVLGRVYTTLTSTRTQRAKIQEKVGALSHSELRKAAAVHLPPLAIRILAWLDR